MQFTRLLKYLASASVVLLLFSGIDVKEAHAQRFQIKWLNVGSFHNYYSEGGIEPRRNPRQGLQWPAYDPHTDHFVRKALWIGVKNWTAPNGEEWINKIAHVGPRMQGEEEFYPIEFELRAKFDEPAVTVDELQSFSKPVFSSTIDEVDPSMNADRMIYNKLNTLQGITVERRVRAFSQEYHDNYHVIEYVLTNTGNVDGDEEIELPEQTLEGVVLGLRHKYTINLSAAALEGSVNWGRNQVTDVVGDGQEDYESELRAMFTWHGRIPSFTRYNNLGAPVWDDGHNRIAEGDSIGRLAAHQFIGRAFMHADKSASDDSDDPGQPSTTQTFDSGLLQGDGNNAWNVPGMAEQYEFMTSGHQYPHHADRVAPSAAEYANWRERMANATERASEGVSAGIVPFEAYGPYTLGPGESVRIVYTEGISGLSRQAAIDVGKAYKRSGGDDDLLIDYDANNDGEITTIADNAANVEGDEQMTKNAWAMTSRDSLFKTFRRATANFESGFNIPQPPRPPQSFTVTSGADRITLDWTAESNPPGGFEIYRTRNLYRGAVEDDYQYQLVATLDPDARSYEDSDVTRGINYFYYIQAVGADRPADPATMTPGGPLRSSRYYTQTYTPATLKRAPAASLEDVRIVPNPYNVSAAQEVRWPERNRIAFLEVPGNCSIKIFTERGDLVQEIQHTDGSGDEFWNLQTMANQMIVSGVYHAVIRDLDTGEQVIRSFTVIR